MLSIENFENFNKYFRVKRVICSKYNENAVLFTNQQNAFEVIYYYK